MTRLGKLIVLNLVAATFLGLAVWSAYMWGHQDCIDSFNAAALACDEEQGDE